MRAHPGWLAGVVLALVAGGAAGADGGDSRREYLRALERFEQGKGGSLERVFESGRTAARELLEADLRRIESPPSDGGSATPVDLRLPGFHITTEEVYVAEPDSRFFAELARRRGTAVDREFFELLHRTFQGSVWRVYTVQQTDYSGCHVFDHPELGALYRNWTRFWATHARAYTQWVEREVKAVEDVVARGTCACGDRASVEAGLESFLKSFPRSPVAPQVRTRLEQVRAGTSGVRFNCLSS